MLNMIRSTALAAVLLLAASPAAAEPFQSFLRICTATNADRGAAAEAARNAGWKALDADMIPDMGDDIRDPVIYVNFDVTRPDAVAPESIEVMVTGWADGSKVMEMPGMIMDICGVMSPGADTDTLYQQMTAKMGFAGRIEETYTYWLYSQQNGRLVSEAALFDAEDEEITAALRQRRLYAVYLLDEEDMGGIMVGALRLAGQTAP